MNWTTRLRRHGGMAAVASKRRHQFQVLAGILGRKAQDAKNAIEWLEGNSLRVLSLAEEQFFHVSKVVFS